MVDGMEETEEWDGSSVFSAVRDGKDDGGGEDVVGNGSAEVTSAENITRKKWERGGFLLSVWHIFH